MGISNYYFISCPLRDNFVFIFHGHLSIHFTFCSSGFEEIVIFFQSTRVDFNKRTVRTYFTTSIGDKICQLYEHTLGFVIIKCMPKLFRYVSLINTALYFQSMNARRCSSPQTTFCHFVYVCLRPMLEFIIVYLAILLRNLKYTLFPSSWCEDRKERTWMTMLVHFFFFFSSSPRKKKFLSKLFGQTIRILGAWSLC